MRARHLHAALVAVALGVALTPSRAAERIFFEQGAFGPEEEFIRTYVARETERLLDAPLSDDGVFVARFDLNGDGQYELLVLLSSFELCGFHTCSAVVFSRQDGEWRILTGIDVPRTGRYSIVAADERHDGYISLLNGDEVQYWDGERYRSECLSRRCWLDLLE